MLCLIQIPHQILQWITQKTRQFMKTCRGFQRKDWIILAIIILSSNLKIPHSLGEKYYLTHAGIDLLVALFTMLLTFNLELLLILIISSIFNILNYNEYVNKSSLLYQHYTPVMEWLYIGALSAIALHTFRKKHA